MEGGSCTAGAKQPCDYSDQTVKRQKRMSRQTGRWAERQIKQADKHLISARALSTHTQAEDKTISVGAH